MRSDNMGARADLDSVQRNEELSDLKDALMVSKLVNDLSEVYQPIYGHPEYSVHASRPSVDRMNALAKVYRRVSAYLGRDLKVLDLGCAQGYFSLELAAQGATVIGVDYDPKNIALCKALAAENPQLKASFVRGRLEDAVRGIEQDSVDLVLALSVLHHVIHESGLATCRSLVETIAHRSRVAVMEIALRGEPPYWGASQPESSRALFENIAFVRELARHPTHLSTTQRPMYVISNKLWMVADDVGVVDSWRLEPHRLAGAVHQGSRRYLFDSDRILKHYVFDHPIGGSNLREFRQEVAVLGNPPAGVLAPRLILQESDAVEGWVLQERLRGRVLLDVLCEESTPSFEPTKLLVDVLEQLAALEKANLFHNDIRTWNVFIEQNGRARLIDFGSVSSVDRDVAWPHDVHLSFLVFAFEAVFGITDAPFPLRAVALSPNRFPNPLREWVNGLWKEPIHDWSFALMHGLLLKAMRAQGSPEIRSADSLWQGSIEGAVNELAVAARAASRRMDLLDEKIDRLPHQSNTGENSLQWALRQIRLIRADGFARRWQKLLDHLKPLR